MDDREHELGDAGDFGRSPPELTQMSRERFEQVLVAVRNGAYATLVSLVVEDDAQHEAKIADARDVWHAAEVALGILLLPRYVPKREAMNDVRALVQLYGEEAS
jgi:hypothetical protein